MKGGHLVRSYFTIAAKAKPLSEVGAPRRRELHLPEGAWNAGEDNGEG